MKKYEDHQDADLQSQASSVMIQHGGNEIDKNGQMYRYLHKVDIFAFLPVPRTDQVSTRRSICGSLILLALFLGYIAYSFTIFLTKNVPRLNQYEVELDPNQEITAPEIAFNYFSGDPLIAEQNYTDLKRFFSFSLKQSVKTKNVSKTTVDTDITFKPCNTSEITWIYDQNYTLICPDYANQTNAQANKMKGLLYATEDYQYIDLKLKYCDKNRPELNCASDQELAYQLSGGRLILFVQKSKMRNFATKSYIDTNIDYYAFYYFLVPELYNRAEIVFGLSQAKEYPNYFSTFDFNYIETLQITGNNFYQSNVTYNSVVAPQTGANLSAFQVMLRLDASTVQIDVVYVTFIDVISQWGAFWGVLFAMFALYFLRYNETQFYTQYPDWERFDNKIKDINDRSQSALDAPLQNENSDSNENEISNLQYGKKDNY